MRLLQNRAWVALWALLQLLSPLNIGQAQAAMTPSPEAQTLHFKFMERKEGPGFTQDVYTREGTSLSFIRTDLQVTAELIEEVFELDLKAVIEHVKPTQPPDIKVVREPELKALSSTFLRMGFLTFESLGANTVRLEMSGLAMMEGRFVKLRYSDLSTNDPRKSSADAMLFFKHLMLLAPKPN